MNIDDTLYSLLVAFLASLTLFFLSENIIAMLSMFGFMYFLCVILVRNSKK